jgi:hypothetical protein
MAAACNSAVPQSSSSPTRSQDQLGSSEPDSATAGNGSADSGSDGRGSGSAGAAVEPAPNAMAVGGSSNSGGSGDCPAATPARAGRDAGSGDTAAPSSPAPSPEQAPQLPAPAPRATPAKKMRKGSSLLTNNPSIMVPFDNLGSDVTAVRDVGGHATYLMNVYGGYKVGRIVVGELVVLVAAEASQHRENSLDAIVVGVGKVVERDICLVSMLQLCWAARVSGWLHMSAAGWMQRHMLLL